MKLILVRHAEAVDLGIAGITTDFDRPLTELGCRQAEALAQAFQTKHLIPSAILTSPLVRARQTADALANAITPGVPPEVNDRLALGELKPRKLSRELNEHGGEVLILVGHQPDLGEYLAWLLDADEESFTFEKGAAAGLDFGKKIEQGNGTLEWLVPPLWFLPE